jgi:predicted O-methyltransferase YrrM
MLLMARIPVIGRAMLTAYRLQVALRHQRKTWSATVSWLFSSRETTNFTYHLTADNRAYLAVVVAEVTGRRKDEIESWFDELEGDQELRRHLLEATRRSPRSFMADEESRYGRRLGWYACVRAMKPRVVIETGVDKGLGSCILAAALKRNTQEGFAGRYYGTDINPAAGYLLSGEYRQYGEILYGDSITSLQSFNGTIDLFINDSDHSADYEAREYETILPKLGPRSILLGDNAHCNNRLLEFSVKHQRKYLFFKEVPERHWYPGAGIGVSWNPDA